MKIEIVKADNIKELESIGQRVEAVTAGTELVKEYFNFIPTLRVDPPSGISFLYTDRIHGQGLLVINIKKHIQIFINKNLEVIYSYININGVWQLLDRQQATKELYNIYKALGAEELRKRKESNIQSKYNLIGYLLKYKFKYKTFLSWEKTINNFICFNFINEEGYNRSWITNKRRIIEYLNYNNADIKKALFE